MNKSATLSPPPRQLFSALANDEQSRQQLLHNQRLATIGAQTGRIAHELNNTLTALLGWAQQGVKAGNDCERANKALQEVLTSAQRATEICRGLLGLSRSQSSQKQIVPVNDLIAEASGSLASRLDKSRISLRCRCPDDLAVYGRRIELVQVFLNILINSCQAMADRGGTIRISANQLDHGPLVGITISDTGLGICPDNIQQIFEPFFSTKASADSADLLGTGLGLAICRDIVADHGGSIQVESAEGQGASFKIFLPSRQGD